MRRPKAVSARVVRGLEDGALVLVEVRDLGHALLGVLDHRPELDERERPAVQAAARLPEERRALRRELDEERRERDGDDGDGAEEEREEDVDGALGHHRGAVVRASSRT